MYLCCISYYCLLGVVKFWQMCWGTRRWKRRSHQLVTFLRPTLYPLRPPPPPRHQLPPDGRPIVLRDTTNYTDVARYGDEKFRPTV